MTTIRLALAILDRAKRDELAHQSKPALEYIKHLNEMKHVGKIAKQQD